MSNPTHDSPNPGRKRRRRNRGGQNRNEQNPQGRQGGHGDGSQPRREGGRREGGARREGGPRNNDRQRERRAMPKPAPKLTFWQKLLKAIGLYKEPVRPARTPQPDRIREDRGEREDRGGRGERPDRSGQPVKSNIRIARPQERKESGPIESPRLYLGNLSYDVTEGDLTDLFKGIGGVRNVEIVYNRNTHRSKGYGFVEMLHVDDAKRSIEVLHDQPFMGRKMNVSSAKSKGFDEREDKDDDRPARPERRPSSPAQEIVPAVAATAAAADLAEAAEIPAVTDIETAPAGVDATPVALDEAVTAEETEAAVSEATTADHV